jgi:hypothetical protein
MVWINSMIRWNLLASPQSRRNPSPPLCYRNWQNMDYKHLEIQWRTWVHPATQCHTMAPSPTRTSFLHNGRNSHPPRNQQHQPESCTMMLTVSQSHHNCWPNKQTALEQPSQIGSQTPSIESTTTDHHTSCIPTKANQQATHGTSLSRDCKKPTPKEPTITSVVPLANGTAITWTKHGIKSTAKIQTLSTASPQNPHHPSEHTSISFPRKTNCLTPISGHLKQNYFIADSHESCTYVTPPPERDLYCEMEDQILSFFHLFNDFTAKGVAQAIWTGNAIIGTNGSVLQCNLRH